MSFVVHRVAKHAARYTDAGGREKCGYCRFFVAPRSCGKVIGPVSPAGWCKYFSRQMVSQSGGSINAGGGASFDQNFLTGSLGTGAVFTRASTGTYYDSAGVLRSAAINTPRFDYDPQTLQLKGLLLEDASTNVMLQSADLSNASVWVREGAGASAAPTVTGNQITAPDGTLTAARIAYPAVGGGDHSTVFQGSSALGAASSATFSVWLRGNVGGETLYICMTPDGAAYTRTQVTLTTAWQRFSVTKQSLTAVPWYFIIGTDMRDPAQAVTPAQTIYAWGAQVEALPYMSSHIPTTSVSVTRARDSLYYPIPAAVPGYTVNYSLFMDFIPYDASKVVGGISDASFGANTSYFSNSNWQCGGAVGALPLLTSGAINKQCATVVGGGTTKLSNNGGVVNSITGAATQSGATRLAVGSDPWSLTTTFGGWMRATKYWPRVLSDSEMQAVTTLAGPTLSLDFMLPNSLDPRITFARASSATYTDASGMIQTAATNAPRWDYDPTTHALKGLLIEEQRMNLLSWSGDLNNAVWSKFANIATAPITAANQTTAPDGTLTAARITYPAVSGAGAYSCQYQGITGTATQYTISIWLKGAVGGEQTYIEITDNVTYYVSPRLTLTTQWQRFFVTSSSPLTATAWYLILGTDLRSASQSSTPAQTIYAWGAQFEQGSFGTSYIPTTSVAVTRAADIAQMPTNASWFNANFGTLMGEFIWLGEPTDYFSHYLSLVGANANNDYIGQYMQQNNSSVHGNMVSGGTGLWTGTVPSPTITAGSVHKTALAYQPASAEFAQDGMTSGVSAVTGSLPTVNKLAFFGDQIGYQQMPTGYMRRVNYWNRALSDTEMQQVTT
jgi:hypothetical protein